MKPNGPAWGTWLFIFAVGVCVGVFFTAVAVETETLSSSSAWWKFIRSGSALAAALLVVVGGILQRRKRR
jgi:hypothetical protein